MYYEKLDLINRQEIVEFESSLDNNLEKLEKKLNNIASWLDESKVNEISNEILEQIDSIGISIYPKKVVPLEQNNDQNFISDEVEKERFVLKQENTFIKVPIPIQILGILWITEVGKVLDDKMGEFVYGNRLIKKGVDDDGVEYKGRLFKQYHHQYSKWWKRGLTKARSILRDDKQDVTLINFDIKSFYHSICLEKNDLKEAIGYTKLSPQSKRLHRILELVLDKYKKLITESGLNQNNSGLSLPIGYFPSHILANWYLQKFDKAISETLRPAYYGRYVDDLFLVYHSGVTRDKEKQKKEKAEIAEQVQKSIEEETDDPFIFLSDQIKITETQHRFIKLLDNQLGYRISSKQDPCEKGIISIDFTLKNATGLGVQSEKLFVYELSVGSPANLIENFIREQRRRSSEFRFESEESDEVPSDFGDILFEQSFDNEDGTKAKIKNLSQDKFKLSVFLSRLLKRSSRGTDHDFTEQLEKIISYYQGVNCISSWWTWEKVILALIINKKKGLFRDFFDNCIKAIDTLENAEELSPLILNLSKLTLKKYLTICINNGLAGDPNFLSNRMEIILVKENIDLDFAKVRKNSFTRNEYLAFPIISLVQSTRNINFSFFSFYESNENIQSLKESTAEIFNPLDIEYPPIPVKFWQIAYLEWLKRIYSLKTKTGSSIKRTFIDETLLASKVLDSAFHNYFKINYKGNGEKKFRQENFYKWSKEIVSDLDFQRDQSIEPKKHGLRKVGFKVNSEIKEKVRFGLVNEFVQKNNYYQSAKGKPNLKDRRESFLKILDEAQKKKCDIVIQPELAVPHSFIPDYCQYADRHQLGLVAGIEHLRSKDVIYNFVLTVLPIKIDGVYKDAIPVLRLKNHYAHIEEVMVNNLQGTVPKPLTYDYHLFQWRGLYFTNYYCYELADINHRIIFQGEIDVLIAPVWNPDTNYYNGIVETSARELHCIFSQVNTANYGDTRWTLPAKTELKNPTVVKGGTTQDHGYIMALAEIEPMKLREFQFLDFQGQKDDGSLKPTPPDFPRDKVKKRMNNEILFEAEE